MQAITFPTAISAEAIRETLVDSAWTLLQKRHLTLASFVQMIALNAPNTGGAVLFHEAIRRAIAEEAIRLARALADQGLQHYPNDPQLLKYQKGLAPPKVISQTPSTHNHSRTMRWLSAHSHEYVGQWIAVQDGVLVGTGPSRRALVEQLGALAEQADVMITRVPAT